VDTLISILQDFQPAAIVIAIVAIIGLLAGMVEPRIGPWVCLAGLLGVSVYVGTRVSEVDARPAWLLPLALAGALAAVGAAVRLYRAITATANNDRTVAYVFPTALAIVALWLSIALIEMEKASVTTAITR
jgi:hypothetical protein